MTKDKDDILGAAVSVAVSTGLATKVGPFAGRLAGSLSGQVAKRLFGMARSVLTRRDIQKFEDWLHQVAASGEYGSPDKVIQVIHDNIDQPWAHGPLEDAVRAIRDGIDEAALVYLAKLAAWQVRDQMPPDRWSRRAARLLLDSDAPMVEALEHLANHLPSRWPRQNSDIVRIAMGGPDVAFRGMVTILPVRGIVVAPNKEHAWDRHPLYRELFALLRAHQFATEEGGRFAHEGKMLMNKTEAIYLVRLFQGSVAAAKFPGSE
jgi:hypothetical protein